jgi:hypothetical protein
MQGQIEQVADTLSAKLPAIFAISRSIDEQVRTKHPEPNWKIIFRERFYGLLSAYYRELLANIRSNFRFFLLGLECEFEEQY